MISIIYLLEFFNIYGITIIYLFIIIYSIANSS